ncbi:methylated-DNA--[protein]-cysteine S-methyltransferase [Paenibacillus sp. FSL R10-2734]|uniref:methylated-DNA--[protein]-cysteine S-methyltransferase n=1 Tax=Paenibacillus sp. FSL R10-2734 TaxID=2954691 RepID=UPI0030DAE330
MENRTNTTLYWTLLTYKEWSFYIAASEKGLSYVGSQQKPFDEMSEWVTRRFPGSELVQDEEKMEPYAKELIEYLQGNRQTFSFPFDYRGTPFQLAVWKALCEIPYGQTWSYSDIATHIQKPAAVRAVGTAIGANPILITVPCHRVIGKNGTLTGYRGGLEMKTNLLNLEKGGSVREL